MSTVDEWLTTVQVGGSPTATTTDPLDNWLKTVTVAPPRTRIVTGSVPGAGVAMPSSRTVTDVKIDTIPEAMIFAASDPEARGQRMMRYWGKKLPFGAAITAAELIALRGAVKEIKAGKPSQSAYRVLGDYLITAEESKDDGFMKKVWEVASAIPGFATEFAVTGGGYTLAKEATAKGIGTAAVSVLGKAAQATLPRAIGVAAQTALNPSLIASSVAEKFVPKFDLTVDDAGMLNGLIVKDDPSFLEALAKGTGSAAIEVGSERGGAVIGWMAPGLAKLPGVARVAAMKAAVVNRYLGKGKTVQGLQEALKKGGWNGVLGEVLEERMGEVARGATGIEGDFGTTGKVFTDPKQALYELSVEGAAFLAPLAANAPAAAADAITRMMPANRQAAQIASQEAAQVAREDQIVSNYQEREAAALNTPYAPARSIPARVATQLEAIRAPSEHPAISPEARDLLEKWAANPDREPPSRKDWLDWELPEDWGRSAADRKKNAERMLAEVQAQERALWEDPRKALQFALDDPENAAKLAKSPTYKPTDFEAAGMPAIPDPGLRKQWKGWVREALKMPPLPEGAKEALLGEETTHLSTKWARFPEGTEVPDNPRIESLATPFGTLVRVRPEKSKGLKEQAPAVEEAPVEEVAELEPTPAPEPTSKIRPLAEVPPDDRHPMYQMKHDEIVPIFEAEFPGEKHAMLSRTQMVDQILAKRAAQPQEATQEAPEAIPEPEATVEPPAAISVPEAVEAAKPAPEQLVKDHTKLATQIARKIARSNPGVELDDLKQDAMVKLLELSHSWDGSGDFGALANTSIRRYLIDKVQGVEKPLPQAAEDTAEPVAPVEEPDIEQREEIEDWEKTISSLSDAKQQRLAKMLASGMTAKAIAAELGISPEAARKQIGKVREKLKAEKGKKKPVSEPQPVQSPEPVTPEKQLSSYAHDKGYDQIVSLGRKGARTRKNKDLIAARDADVKYQELLKTVNKKRRGEATAEGKTETAEKRSKGLKDAAAGKVTEEAIIYAPVHELPQTMRVKIQQEAELLISETKSEAVKSALQKIIKDAGSDVGAAVENQKERIIGRIRGGIDSRPLAARDAIAPRDPDPVVELIMATPDVRVTMAQEAIASIEEGKPNELAREADRTYKDTTNDPFPMEEDVIQYLRDLAQLKAETVTEETFTLEPDKPKPKPTEFDTTGKGKQGGLFSKKGLPNQTAMFEGLGVPDELVKKPPATRPMKKTPAAQQAKPTPASVISAVRSAAADPAARWLTDKKVLISALYQSKDWGMTLPEFKKLLVQMNRDGQIELGRADLVTAADKAKLAQLKESSTGDGPAEKHFVRVPEGTPKDRPMRRMAGGAAGSANQAGMPVQDIGTGERIGAREVVETLEQKFHTPIRSGRLRGKDLRGVYKTIWGNVRLKSEETAAIDVATHEVAHAVDAKTDVLVSAPRALKDEVKQLDYDPQALRPEEGFAEFVRGYLTGDINVQQATPQFYAYFQNWLESHPPQKAAFEQSKGLIDRWRAAGAEGRVKGQISQTGKPLAPPIKEELPYLMHRFYQAIKDQFHFGHLFEGDTKSRGYNPAPGSSFMDLATAFNQGGATLANTALESGVFTMSDAGQFKRIGTSLWKAMEPITKQEYDNWVAWAYARHALESWQTGKNPGITESDAQVVYDAGRHNAHWAQAADAVTQFNRDLVQVLVDSGVITPATGTAITDAYQTYLPLFRVIPKRLGKDGMHGGVRLVDMPTPLKRRSGSGYQILDPVQSTVRQAMIVYERSAAQIVTNEMVKAAETHGGNGWIEKLPPNMQKTAVELGEVWDKIKDTMAATGMDPLDIEALESDMDAATLNRWRTDIVNVYRPNYWDQSGQSVVRVTLQGQPTLFYVNDDLYKTITGMGFYQLPGVLDKTLGALTRTIRLGATTLNPTFVARNFLRDMPTYAMQREHGKLGDPMLWVGTYAYSEFQRRTGHTENPFVKLYRQHGGQLSSVLSPDRASVRRAIQSAVSGKQKFGIVENLMDIMQVTEAGPRLAEFAAVFKKHGYSRDDVQQMVDNGTVPRDVLVEALNASHEVTVDFRRAGTVGKVFTRLIPFWNARLEGIDKSVRTWKDHPSRTFARFVAYAAVPSILYWLWHKDEDWYKERQAWLDSYWVLSHEGKPYARIPRGHEVAQLGAGVEAILDSLYRRDPESMKRWAAQMWKSTRPEFNVAGVSTAMQIMRNKDVFGRPIVPKGKEGLEPRDQSLDYNTATMKAIGSWLNVSPAKLEYAVNSATGGMYRNATPLIESFWKGDPLSPADVPIVSGFSFRSERTRSVDEYYDHLDTAQRKYKSSKASGRILTQEQTEDYVRMTGAEKVMKALRAQLRGTEDAQERDKIEKHMTGIARWALKKPPLKRYPNPVSSE